MNVAGFRITGLFVLVILVAACREVEETDNPMSRSLSDLGATSDPSFRSTSIELSRIQFDDIPVPAGFFFRNQRNESFAYRDGNQRIGRFVYWGRGDEKDLIDEYLEKMPKDPYNWTLKSAPSDRNAPLIFEKPGQRCEIHLGRERHRPNGGLLITISVESS
ncbi:MAG: hypothetical protein KDB53_12925 [Planctomycetes bacterium]|nr:hypothetical protein [Planctomycetota bacterium]